MHEIGYCEALLSAVEQRAIGRPVSKLGIIAGVRHRLVPEAMQMAWQLAAADTPYRDAVTVLGEVVMTGTCRLCGNEFATNDTLAECARCGAIGPALTGGDEFMLAWLEYADGHDREEAHAAVPGPSADDYHDHAH